MPLILSQTKYNPLAQDLDLIINHTKELWEDVRGQRIFITGGTGFFGCWLLESFAWANEKLALGASVVVLTRNYEAFKRKMPHLANNPAIQFQVGDVRNFDFPDGEFKYIIHAAATSATNTFHNEDILVTFDTIVSGTRHVLDFAAHCRAKNILFTSSGVVYGRQSADTTHISEEYSGSLTCAHPHYTWAEAKRAAACLCYMYSKKYGINLKIVHCFSFIGPYLPLDIHYAVGNFIRDALAGGPIKINSDGTPRRAYLYAADLMIWLWTILFRGESGCVYNVGSDQDKSIAEVANAVAESFSNHIEIKIAKPVNPEVPIERYVPSIERARKELGLKPTVGLAEAIKRTIQFIKQSNKII